MGYNGSNLTINKRNKSWNMIFAFTILLIFYCGVSLALEPPTQEQIEEYRRDGTLTERIEAAKALGNHLVPSDVSVRASYKLNRMFLEKQGLSLEEIHRILAPPPEWRGMPTTGTVKILALLIDFPDYPHSNTAESIQAKLFGDGTVSPPYESLRNYYRRSSYNQLEIQGDVLGWYTTSYNRSTISQTTTGRETLIKEALNYYNAQGHDFSQYDNNGDGAIDYLVVIWAGPDNGWANFWWGYMTNFADSSYRLDGKGLRTYSWQWEARPYPGTFSPRVVIHETGHGLGLPDYYDYDENVGPDGGVGGLDMMDANWGDHNCFSKFLLDWISPTAYNSGSQTVTLNAAGTTKEDNAVVIMRGITQGEQFAEFFMVQNRYRAGNDTGYLTDGLLIWHVDARLNSGGTDFLYDNSYTSHKLLRLMEADGLEEIETGDGWADVGDYYIAGKTFGMDTVPSSNDYEGMATGISVNNISASGSTMSVKISFDPRPPEILVKAEGTSIPDNTGTYYFGSVALGTNREITFTIENSGDAVLDLTGVPKVQVSGTNSGDFVVETDPVTPVTPGGSTTFVVRFSPNAAGTRNATLSIANNVLNKNPYDFAITGRGSPVYTFPFSDDFSTDKGWIGYEPGGWERGPAASGGGEYGYSDPENDYTPTSDNYILGFALGGDYPNNLPEKGVISPAIDCTGQNRVVLKFWRYLNVESNIFDHAGIFVSNNGLNWVKIWENSTGSLTGNAWTEMSYDISSVAANQSTVYIKFTMGPTDSSWRFSGWNIDDLTVCTDGDIDPPTPDPMTWATVPYATGSASIAMVATAASDPTAPINYFFDFTDSPTAGTGGADLNWQSSTSYTNSGLGVNHQYGYRVKARDGVNNETAYSTPTRYVYTTIETPSGITFGAVTSTSIQVQSTNTLSGLTRGSSGLLIENTTNAISSGWKQDNSFWMSNPLLPNTSYSFRAKGRNGDAMETGYSPTASKYTLANVPGASAFSNIIQTCIRANWTANGNPAGTQYYCENTSTGMNTGWIVSTSWDSCSLTCGTSYSFRVKAKNADGVETGWASLGSQLTVGCDTAPPTPNPMTFSAPPYAANSTSISMTATIATDTGSPPVSYYFHFVNSPTGGTGGTDSSWQSSISHTNSGLQANHQYGHQVKARDSASAPNETSYSSTIYKYTLANTPGASSFSNLTQTCIRANWTDNGNRSGTEYWCENTTQATNSGWTMNLYWDSCSLTCGTSYSFRVKTRNDDGTETGWTNLGSQSTQTCPSGTLQFSSATYSVNENGGSVLVMVTRTGGSSGAVGVSYATSNGSAIASSDYTSTSGILSWANGDTGNKTFTVPITNDTLDEANETFTVTLSSPTGAATLGSPTSATVTITDDDPTPTVQFSAASSSGSEATTPASIAVILSAASGQTVTVNYATANGTATAGSDYTATSGTLTFNPGVTSQTISVPIINDTTVEGNETFTVTLSGPTGGATSGIPSSATVTIIDDDPAPAAYTYILNSNAPYSYIPGDDLIPSASWQGNLDDGYFDLPLGDLDFQFYGTPVNNVRVSTNGYITFGTVGTYWGNVSIPDINWPNPIVAPFWDDLNLTGLTGERGVWWGIFGTAPNRQFVIEWRQVPSFQYATETYSFEVILYESTDRIKFQYLDVDSGTSHDSGSSATVGVENFDGTKGVQYSFNGSSPLSNGLAIEFIPQTLQSSLTVVRHSDNTLWAMTCEGTSYCSSWTQISGKFSVQPTLTWDPSIQKYILMGIGNDGESIWRSTFNADGTWNPDWIKIWGESPSPVAVAGGGFNIPDPPSITNLTVVRHKDNTIWKMTCNGMDDCSAWTQISGKFSVQPTLTWDPSIQQYILIGIGNNKASIWRSTFNGDGTWNNDWTKITGASPSPVAVAGGGFTTEGGGFVPIAGKWSGSIIQFNVSSDGKRITYVGSPLRTPQGDACALIFGPLLNDGVVYRYYLVGSIPIDEDNHNFAYNFQTLDIQGTIASDSSSNGTYKHQPSGKVPDSGEWTAHPAAVSFSYVSPPDEGAGEVWDLDLD